MDNKPISRQSDILVQDLENELLIYDLRTNKAYCLNETSALVFQLSDGARTVSEISELMSKKLGALVSDDFVWLALRGLKKDNLLGNGEELTDYFEGLSRREIIKRVGLTSMIALPIVASVIAPSAVAAQSASPSVRCVDPAECPSGNCASTFFLPVGMFCCPTGNGGAQPGPIATAAGFECFDGCSSAGMSVCCSGSAMSVPCDTAFCASQQQFCCACA